MKITRSLFLLVLLACLNPVHAQWADPNRVWRTLDSEHFTLHFIEEQRARAHAVAQVAEAVYPRITGWLKWEPEARTQIVLLDAADFANGMAWPLPFNWTAIFLSPPDERELLQNREWLELVLTHEFTHIVHLDKAAGAPLFFRRIFGRTAFGMLLYPLPNMFPNVWLPSWVHEGLATYAESDVALRHGRLGNSYFEAMMRAEARRGFLSLREINADGRGFPLNRNYLYGSYFFAFLAERYGEKAVAGYVEQYSDDFFALRVHNSTREVTGKQMDALWVEYLEYLRQRFGAGAAMEVSQSSEVARAFSITSPVLTAAGEQVYVEADGYTRPRLVRVAKDGARRTLRRVERGTRVTPGSEGRLLLARPELCRNYNLYYDVYEVDGAGTAVRLTTCSRFRFVAPMGDGRFAAVRVVDGIAEVVVAARGGDIENTLYRGAPDEAITGLAARGQTVVVTVLRGGRWSLIELTGGTATVWLSDDAVKHSPRFGASEDEVFLIADYDKVYDLWSIRRGDVQIARWTRFATGVREFSAPVGGELLAVTIEADGDALRRVTLPDMPLERRPVATLGPRADESVRPAPASTAADRAYSPWDSLRPRWWMPSYSSAFGARQIGFATSGHDALGLIEYSVAPSYETSQGERLGSVRVAYDGRHELRLDRLMTVKAVTAQGDLAHYTIDEAGQWLSTWRWDSLGRRSFWGVGAAVDSEHYRVVGQGSLRTADERVAALVAGLDTRRSQWLSEGPSEGQQLRFFAETSRRLGGSTNGNVYRADWRGHVPLWRAVFALRWMEAYAQPQAEDFELGGIGGFGLLGEESVGLPVLNQHAFPLRGYLSGEPFLVGHRARLGSAELRVPLADIDRHAMVPPVGLNRVSMTVFGEAGAAWQGGGSPQRYYRGVGMELLAELRVFYLLGVQLRLGVARGLDGPGTTVTYLAVGRSF